MRKQNFWTTDRKSADLGTFNPAALDQSIFQNHLTRNSTYEELAKLSNYAEELRKQNTIMKEKLDNAVYDEPFASGNPFIQFKHFLLSYEKRLAEREAELKDFSSHFSEFRTSSSPTFVQVGASGLRKPGFDPITLSLIVSNEQKKFFKSNDIKDQNEGLRILISKQRESIALIEGRLKMFNQFQAVESIKGTMQSLEQGTLPNSIMISAPSHSHELRTKQRLLSNELSYLVKKRRVIQNERISKKLKRRENKCMNKNAVLIQRFVRGFLLRRRLDKEHKCALKIQRIFRGFIARYKFKLIIEEIRKKESEYEYDEENNNEMVPAMMMEQQTQLTNKIQTTPMDSEN